MKRLLLAIAAALLLVAVLALHAQSRAAAGGDPVTLKGGAQIIDLMADHDPVVRVLVLRIRYRIPMRDRHLLDPLHPHRIVDMPQLVDVLGKSSEGHFEDSAHH